MHEHCRGWFALHRLQAFILAPAEEPSNFGAQVPFAVNPAAPILATAGPYSGRTARGPFAMTILFP